MKMTLIDKDLLRTTIASNTDATEQDAAQIINTVLMKQRKRDTGQREHDRSLVELLRLGPYVRDGAETRATMKQAADQIEHMRETLQGIAEADWRTWDELASPHEFVSWAKNRARHTLLLAEGTE